MKRFTAWWKQDKRYITLIQAVLLGALPILCCLISCAAQGRTIGEVYLPNSEWNDELFYYKQVEGIVSYGYPLGYFGFNESHALRLSFAAWSPVLVFPWILWGLLFGWGLMSPVVCNIVLLTAAVFLFVWLAKPTWRQLGVLALLFSLYTPFVRYMLSTMPEVICFSMLIVFYGLAISYVQRERTAKLVILFVLAAVMTLMRPYLLLFLLLPAYFWVKRSGWKGVVGAAVVCAAVLGAYAGIKHYLGAEYFAPLFFTDWVEAFFEQGLFGGLRYTAAKLYYMGKSFWGHTVQGFRTGLASGAFFAGYLVMLLVLAGQSLSDMRRLRRLRRTQATADKPEADAAKKEAGAAPGVEATAAKKEAGEAERVRKKLVIELHLAFSFVAMLFALLLMYKLTEGSKHLLTFMAAGIFVIGMMDTRFFRKAALIGVTFAYFYSYMAVDPYDYQVPFVTQERQAQLAQWEDIFAQHIRLEREAVPDFENVVIWVFADETPDGMVNTSWQMLYALPEGCGISCCMREYVKDNLDSLQSRYLATVAGGEIDRLCAAAGYAELGRDGQTVLYQRY